jgi:hypothetical protein
MMVMMMVIMMVMMVVMVVTFAACGAHGLCELQSRHRTRGLRRAENTKYPNKFLRTILGRQICKTYNGKFATRHLYVYLLLAGACLLLILITQSCVTIESLVRAWAQR